MDKLSSELRARTSSQRSHSSSIKSIELPPNLSSGVRSPNGAVTPPETLPKHPPEKTSVKDRISRMFSQRSPAGHDPATGLNGTVDSKKHQSQPQQPQQQQQQQQQPSFDHQHQHQQIPTPQPSQASQHPQQPQEPQEPPQQQQPQPLLSPSQAGQAAKALLSSQPALAFKDGLMPSTFPTGTSASTTSATTSGTTSPAMKPQPPSRKGSTTEKMHEKAIAAVTKGSKTGNNTVPSHRFILNPELPGGHEHFLKSSRRQEKLSDLFRGFLGKKTEQQGGDLSLVSSWIDNIRLEKDSAAAAANGDKKAGSSTTGAPPSTMMEKYGKCQEIVGRGAFGVVRISHKKLGDGLGEKLYAVKEFRRRPDENEKKYSKRLTAEFCISSSLHHPNVIHTLDLIKDAKGDLCEVMEFCAGGDLFTLVLSAGKLEEKEADCFFKQMMRGVKYMHEMGVAHRDLKPENLLLTTHGGLKITDFGNGECFRMAWESDAHMVSGLCGSAPYIAPEEYINKEFDARAVDVWACGVIYMAMRTGRHLWHVAKKDEDEFYARYLDGRRDEKGYGPLESLRKARCRNVIYSILDPNPKRRITALQVLKSEWGREIKLCKAGEEGL